MTSTSPVQATTATAERVRLVPVPDPEVLLADHLVFMRSRNLSPVTIGARRYLVLRVRLALGHDVATASRDTLAAWREARALSAPSLATELMHLRGYLRWAHEHGHRPDDPTRVLARPRLPRPIPRPIAEHELQAALAAASSRVRPWLLLAAYCGLRAGEIARLDRRDVLDTEDPPVLVVQGKGGHERIVPLGPIVLAELHAAGMPPRGPLFPRRDGRPGPNAPHRISQESNDALRASGSAATLHTLRHRFGTAIYRGTRDLRLAQELLGHASPRTTAGYAAYSSAAAIDAVRALDARLSATT